MLASTPRWPGPSTVSAGNTTCPAAMSSPAARTLTPTATGLRTSTLVAVAAPMASRPDRPSQASVSSTITTASAPGGSGAPVRIRTASPGPTGGSGGDPAGMVPTTVKVTGAAATSAARTAKPSTAVLANGGTDSSAVTATEVTHPSASPRGMARGRSAGHWDSTRRWASSSGTRLTVPPALRRSGGSLRSQGPPLSAARAARCAHRSRSRTNSPSQAPNSGPRSGRSRANSTNARRNSGLAPMS